MQIQHVSESKKIALIRKVSCQDKKIIVIGSCNDRKVLQRLFSVNCTQRVRETLGCDHFGLRCSSCKIKSFGCILVLLQNCLQYRFWDISWHERKPLESKPCFPLCNFLFYPIGRLDYCTKAVRSNKKIAMCQENSRSR